jgi:predicted dehydrogenase
LFAFASHALYYLQWFAGPMVSLRCRCDRSPQDPREVDTLVLLDARFRSGVTAGVRVDTDNALRQEHSLCFKAGDGTILLKNTGKDYIHGFKLYMRRNRDGDFSEIFPSSGWDVKLSDSGDGRILAVGSLAKRLVQWVQGQGSSQPDFAAAHQVQLLLSLADHSNSNGGTWLDVCAE